MRLCKAELVNGTIVRIFASTKAAIAAEVEGRDVREVPRADAVKQIRLAVFLRDGYRCVDCDRRVSWQNGEMHEVVPKGNGGEVSVFNSVVLCHDCHTGARSSRHGDRIPNLQWLSNKK